MARHIRQLNIFQRASLGVLLVVLLASFYLASTLIMSGGLAGPGVPVDQLAQELPCAATDISYCSLMWQLVPAVESGDFSLLLASQAAISATCPDPAMGQYCSGTAAGVPISLYTIYQAGQPKSMMRNDYIAFLRSYASRAGKLTYMTSKTGAQNPLLFRDQQGTVSLQLQLQQMSDGSWKFLWPIVVK